MNSTKFKNFAVLFLLLGVFSSKSFANCDVCHVRFPQTQNNINLNTGQTFCIESGVFSGNMNVNGSNVTICISEGATFSPNNFSFKSGMKIINRGTFNLGGSTVDGAASIENYGTMNVNGNMNQNNDLNLTNYSTGVINYATNLELKRNSKFVNSGAINVNAEFSSENNTAFTNEGHLKIKRNFNPGGTFTNNGFVVAEEFININSSAKVSNNCTFYSNKGFNNNSNNIFYNNGLIRAEGKIQLNGNSSYNQSIRGILVGIELINNSRVTGSGNYYFTGETRNQGPFGQDANGINFYDASNTSSRIFDIENTLPHASVTKIAIAKEDTSRISAGCSSKRFPVPVATNVVYHSEINKVVYVPLLDIAWDTEVGLNVIETNMLSADNIMRRTSDNARTSSNVFVDEGRGTYYFYPEEGIIEFHPDLNYTGVSTIDYYVKNTLGYRSNIASVTIFIDPSPLPVELVTFQGQLENESVLLSWATASELNNDYFQIERSADGVNFEAIGRVEGNGNSNAFIKYDFTDKNPLAGVNYYRLLQVDYDQQSEYSKIISVEKKDAKAVLSAFPNPAKDIVNITSNQEIANYTLMDLKGAVVKYAQVANERAIVALDDVTSGIYLINVQYKDRSSETIKVIKN